MGDKQKRSLGIREGNIEQLTEKIDDKQKRSSGIFWVFLNKREGDNFHIKFWENIFTLPYGLYFNYHPACNN